MKTIILYTKRNVGLYSLAFLVGLGYNVKVITGDDNVTWLACVLGCDLVTLGTMGEFDLFLCVHGDKIIEGKYLADGKFVNVHPCLFKYKGHNPIKRYIENKDTLASVESHWMTSEVDAGGVIYQEKFVTGEVKTFAEFYNQAVDKYLKCIDRTLKMIL